jgi:hypothetical protein
LRIHPNANPYDWLNTMQRHSHYVLAERLIKKAVYTNGALEDAFDKVKADDFDVDLQMQHLMTHLEQRRDFYLFWAKVEAQLANVRIKDVDEFPPDNSDGMLFDITSPEHEATSYRNDQGIQDLQALLNV